MKQDMIVILDLGSTENTVLQEIFVISAFTVRSILMILPWKNWKIWIM